MLEKNLTTLALALSTIMDMSNSILKTFELLFHLVICLLFSRLIISLVAVSFKKQYCCSHDSLKTLQGKSLL